MPNSEWTKAEKQIARAAFDRALERECAQNSRLDIVFARLINEGWMTIDELAGLAEDKLGPIRFMTR